MILSPFSVVGTAVIRFYHSLALLALLTVPVGPASATLFDRGNDLVDDVVDNHDNYGTTHSKWSRNRL